MQVRSAENVLIGGFIITGKDPKKVIIRGIGPSLSQFFSGVLANPTLELFQGSNSLASNDDWKENQAAVQATGIPPSNDRESAIVRTLAPGSYTAVLRGNGDTSGIGVVEVYDLDRTANSTLANIASRGLVDTDNNVMIGGLIVGPVGGATTTIRARLGEHHGRRFGRSLQSAVAAPNRGVSPAELVERVGPTLQKQALPRRDCGRLPIENLAHFSRETLLGKRLL